MHDRNMRHVCVCVVQGIDGIPTDYIKQFPHIAAHYQRIGHLPAVKAYLAAGGK